MESNHVTIPARAAAILLAFCLALAPAALRAQDHCPWMNAATASGLLGVDATGSYSAAAGQPSVCTFTQQAAGVTRTLEITVETATDPHNRLLADEAGCGHDLALLPAIGNEAFTCMEDKRKGRTAERVIGRVRNQVFTITMSSSMKDDPLLPRDMLQQHIATAAEQVSGNLY